MKINGSIFQAGFGGTNCDPCGVDTFSIGGSEDACTPCPGTSKTNENTQSQSESDCNCEPGYKFITASGCEKCTGDTYSDGTARTCTACTTGKHINPSDIPGEQISDCTSYPTCPAGTYRASEWVCTDCAANKYSSQHTWSSVSTSSECTDCPAGTTVGSGEGKVETDCKCVLGSFYSEPDSTCLECRTGKYSDPDNGQKCLYCPASSTVDSGSGATRQSCECDAGMYLDLSSTPELCKSCPANHYATKGTKSSCTSCSSNLEVAAGAGVVSGSCLCPAGKYWHSAPFAATTCKPCADNKWSVANKDSRCTSCLGDLTSASGYGTSQSACTCPSGHFRQASDNACIACAANSYNLRNREESCALCPGSTTVPAGQGTQRSDCTCPSGYYIDSINNACISCIAQTYSDGTRTDSCITCPANSLVAAGVGAVVADCECEAGLYFDSTTSTCKICPTNQWAAAGTIHSCTACPSSSIIPSNSNQHSVADCICPAGSYRDSDGICQACDYNTWAVQGTDDGCSPCATNTEVDVGLGISAESCHCSAGAFYDVITVDSDDAFIRSSHMDVEELATKMLTEKGCQYCKESTWSTGGRGDTCTACLGDLTVHKGLGTSASTCACAAGHYYSTKTTLAVTTHTCTACPKNTWAPAGKHMACNVCEVGRNVGVGEGTGADDCSASGRSTMSVILLLSATLGLLLW